MNMALADLMRMMREHFPPRPKTVLIVADWISGREGFRREVECSNRPGHRGEWLDEWRISPAAYADLKAMARPDGYAMFGPGEYSWRDPDAAWQLGATPVEFEKYPPGAFMQSVPRGAPAPKDAPE